VKGSFYYEILLDNYFGSKYLMLNENRFGLRVRRYILPRVADNFGKNSLRYLVPKLMNDSPPSCKNFKNMKILKLNLKMWLNSNFVS
jgi:hypothetical protein